MALKGDDRLRGRFQKNATRLTKQFVASIPFDQRIYKHDIAGSIAHAKMLAKQGIISKANADMIISGLSSIRSEIEQGKFEFRSELEDIHMNIENRLFEKIGDAAGQLHTARSRNEQISLDTRLYLKEVIELTIGKLTKFQHALIDVAEANKDAVMPGYTHLQQAQPVLLAHHLLAYFEMAHRDIERFQDCLKRVDVLPLGSGALAGVAYPIDRDFVAKQLGFSRISKNSLDAVSDRDFILEYEAAASLTMMHLSRLAEEIILWSSTEFGFIELDDAYATSSSIMPQKKNPDIPELIRGKAGRVYGSFISLLTVMKGLPLAYNRDLQEDKEGLFDTVDTLLSCLAIFAEVIATLKVNSDKMRNTINSYTLATDLADYLAKKDVPFREAHGITGNLVKYALSKGKSLKEISLKEYQKFSPLFDDDVYDITADSSIESRNVIGGTAPRQVAIALARAKRMVKS
jgi:argininosuccinate lyase